MHLDERTVLLESGESVHCRIWAPDAPASGSPGLLLLHGVESHSLWFEELAPFATARGLTLYAPDRPGWGLSPGPRGHLARYDDAMRFVDRFANLVRERHGALHLAGLSWGGKLALYAALRRPGLFDSLTLIAPGLVPRRSPGPAARLRAAACWLAGARGAYVRLPFREEDFTRRADRAAFIRNDPHRVRAVTVAFCVESLKMDRFISTAIPRLRIPLQLLLAGDDALMDNAATARLISLAGSPAVATRLHEGAAHSLVFETPERTAAELSNWALTPPPPPAAPRSVLIMGAGAVGSAVGALLARAGHAVTLVAREAHARAVASEGLKLTLAGASVRMRENLAAVTDPADAPRPADLALLCVKSFDTEAAAAALARVLPAGVPVLSLQNGVRNEARLAGLLPGRPLVAGAICAYLSMDAPGEVRIASDRGGLALGPWRLEDRAQAVRAQALLADTGLEVLYHPDGPAVKWSKLMLNVAFNAANALTRLPTAKLLRHPRLGPLAVAAFAECAAVMRARGFEAIDLPGYRVRLLARVMRLPARLARFLLAAATAREAEGASSMARDLDRGGATEIGEINGAVVAEARALGLPAPANGHLVRLLELAGADPALRQALRDEPSLVAEGWPPAPAAPGEG